MNNQTSKWALASVGLGFVAALLLIFSGYGYQWGWWGLGTAFTWLLPATLILGLISFSLVIIYGFTRWSNPQKQGVGAAMAGLVLSLAVMGTIGYWFAEAQKYPPIHDISTDIENPPTFKAIVPLRADVPNDTTYDSADLQLLHYPDVQALYMDMKYDEAFDRALRAAEQMPWEQIVAVDRQQGRIEAIDKLPWFGFKDDVVIRIDTAKTTGHYKLDVRSVSRMGRGDIGVNAHRIREYLATVQNN